MTTPGMPVYLDCAATAPLDRRVFAAMRPYFEDEFGNAGSRTHGWGQRARAAVERARGQVAAVVGARRGDVIFTSGATESNNLALLGLLAGGPKPRHVVSTMIEHHAILAPLEALERRGVGVTLVPPGPDGVVDADRVLAAVRPETTLVSLMHVNNETGARQPIEAVADGLNGTGVYLHVDAAQSFGRELAPLRHPRVDLISASAHKIGGPKGIGALVVRERDGRRPPLEPLLFGGGQERGLRPGTMPVALAVGFGVASELAMVEADARRARCLAFREQLLDGLAPLEPIVNGDLAQLAPYIINLSCPGLVSEVVMDAWRDLAAISNGAACSSQAYTCSHVLGAMGLPRWRSDGALRFSWTADTPQPDWDAMVSAVEPYRDVKRAVAT